MGGAFGLTLLAAGCTAIAGSGCLTDSGVSEATSFGAGAAAAVAAAGAGAGAACGFDSSTTG